MGAAIALHGLVGLETANCREIASHAAKDMAKLLSALDNVSDPVLHSSIGVSISDMAGLFIRPYGLAH